MPSRVRVRTSLAFLVVLIPSAIRIHRLQTLLFGDKSRASFGWNPQHLMLRRQIQRAGDDGELHSVNDFRGFEWVQNFHQTSLLGLRIEAELLDDLIIP